MKRNHSSEVMAMFEKNAELLANNFLGEADGFAGQADATNMPDYDRTLSVRVTNTSTDNKTAIVFGQYTNPSLTQSSGVTVEVLESSHAQVAAESAASPFTVRGWKLFVNSGSVSQLSNSFTFKRRSSQGVLNQAIMQPINYKSAANNQDNQIDALNYSFTVGGNDSVEFTINASTTITWVLYLSKRVDLGNVLSGSGMIELNSKPAPSGQAPLLVQGVN